MESASHLNYVGKSQVSPYSQKFKQLGTPDTDKTANLSNDIGRNMSEDESLVQKRYVNAEAFVNSVFSRYRNGSHRTVDPEVITQLSSVEHQLRSIQCLINEGPAAKFRETKVSSVKDVTSATGTSSTFTLCGGGIFGDSVMKSWDALGEVSPEEAMGMYVDTIDQLLPRWDHQIEYPIALQDKEWSNDDDNLACAICDVDFTLFNRRHHCRRCFKIVCSDCSPHELDMALNPGAPIRKHRTCENCYREIQDDQSLVEVRLLKQKNMELEIAIKDIEINHKKVMEAKEKEKDKLRNELISMGSDPGWIDFIVHKRLGNIPSSPVATPASHQFKPQEVPEANQQLHHANRQLKMALKVAECRADRLAKRMDLAISVLVQELSSGSVVWSSVTSQCLAYLSLKSLGRIEMVCQQWLYLSRKNALIRKFVYERGVPQSIRSKFWYHCVAKDPSTAARIRCVAVEIRTKHGGRPPVSQRDAAIILTDNIAPGTKLHEDLYNAALSNAGATGSSADDAQIGGDVKRTFGNGARRQRLVESPYKNVDVVKRKLALTNVLRAYSSLESGVGYCQGMNFLTAMILSNLEWEEHDAFWILLTILSSEKFSLENVFRAGLPHLNLRFYQLERLMKMHLPEIHEHMRIQGFHPSMFASGWFMTLFTNFDTLPYEVVSRVFDCFLIDGWKVIFRVALAFLRHLQNEILKLDFEGIVNVFYEIEDEILFEPTYLLFEGLSFKVTNRLLARLTTNYFAQDTPRRCSFLDMNDNCEEDRDISMQNKTFHHSSKILNSNYGQGGTKSGTNHQASGGCNQS